MKTPIIVIVENIFWSFQLQNSRIFGKKATIKREFSSYSWAVIADLSTKWGEKHCFASEICNQYCASTMAKWNFCPWEALRIRITGIKTVVFAYMGVILSENVAQLKRKVPFSYYHCACTVWKGGCSMCARFTMLPSVYARQRVRKGWTVCMCVCV